MNRRPLTNKKIIEIIKHKYIKNNLLSFEKKNEELVEL